MGLQSIILPFDHANIAVARVELALPRLMKPGMDHHSPRHGGFLSFAAPTLKLQHTTTYALVLRVCKVMRTYVPNTDPR